MSGISLLRRRILECIFTLAARGASVDLRVEYANELDMPIQKRTSARRIDLRSLCKAFFGVKLPLLYEA